MLTRVRAIRHRDRVQRLASGPSGRRGRQRVGQLDDPERADAVMEIAEAVDMRVERRRADAQLAGQSRQRELLEAITV